MKKIFAFMMILVVSSMAYGKIYSIGVTQFYPSPSVDRAREGFEKALVDKGLIYKINYDNAHGNITTQEYIIKKYDYDAYDIVLAATMPTAKIAAGVIKKSPLLFMAVNYPKRLGIVTDTSTNVTGTSDRYPEDKAIEDVHTILPRAKTIGVVYDSRGKGAEIELELLEAAAKKYGMRFVARRVDNEKDALTAVDTVLKNTDVLYMLADGLTDSLFDIIIRKADAANKPVIGQTEEQVKKGALFTLSIDYYTLGYDTGLMAVEILKGKDPSEIPVKTYTDFFVVINDKASAKYGVDFTKINR